MANDLTEGTKHDGEKNQLDLFSPYAYEATSEILSFGAIKYEAYNWNKGVKYSRVFAALLRHLFAFWKGENLDEETGKHHLAHAMCCLMFLLHYEVGPVNYDNFDDRYYADTRTV